MLPNRTSIIIKKKVQNFKKKGSKQSILKTTQCLNDLDLEAHCTLNQHMSWKPENRSCNVFILMDNQLFTHAGIGQTIYEDNHAYDLHTNTWRKIDTKDFIGNLNFE